MAAALVLGRLASVYDPPLQLRRWTRTSGRRAAMRRPLGFARGP
jgi:hypothetical protein